MKIRRGMNKGRGEGRGMGEKKRQIRIGGKRICREQAGSQTRALPELFSNTLTGEPKVLGFRAETAPLQTLAINKPNIGVTEPPRQPKLPALVAKADAEACVLCGTCQEVCLAGAISVKATVVVDGEKCFGCGQCLSECPSDALSLINIQ